MVTLTRLNVMLYLPRLSCLLKDLIMIYNVWLALRTGRLYPTGNIPGTHFCRRLSLPRGHSAAGRIMSMKNSNDTIGNRTRGLPTCSAVP
jgi:hypothetical protein